MLALKVCYSELLFNEPINVSLHHHLLDVRHGALAPTWQAPSVRDGLWQHGKSHKATVLTTHPSWEGTEAPVGSFLRAWRCSCTVKSILSCAERRGNEQRTCVKRHRAGSSGGTQRLCGAVPSRCQSQRRAQLMRREAGRPPAGLLVRGRTAAHRPLENGGELRQAADENSCCQRTGWQMWPSRRAGQKEMWAGYGEVPRALREAVPWYSTWYYTLVSKRLPK